MNPTMTGDILDQRIAVRRDLLFTPDCTARTAGYLVEDALHGAFYRLGMREYRIAQNLDGSRTVREAWEATHSDIAPQDRGSMETARSLAHWLIRNSLIDQGPSRRPAGTADAWERFRNQSSAMERFSPFTIRIPVFNPERLLRRMEPWFGWLFTWPTAVVFLLFGFVAVWRLTIHREAFAASLHGILSPGGSLAMMGAWLFLKTAHELGHGVACHRYGGSVRSAGVMLILFAPVAYVDVTSSWRFREKSQRLMTAAAGMYVELLVAVVAALVWSVTEPGVWNQWCANCVVLASITTVLFNANPLMRYDGYYIASDLLGIPNLYGRGTQFVKYIGSRYLWGESVSLPCDQHGVQWLVAAYGVTSLIWRVIVVSGLIVAAAGLFHGAGVLLSIFGLVVWLALPAMRLGVYLIRGNGRTIPRRGRFLFVVTSTAALSALLLTNLPWPFAPTAPGYVEFAPLVVLRAATPGFVREIRVRDGQEVRSGDTLFVLENDTLVKDRDQKRLEIEKLEVVCRSLQRKRNMAELESEMSRLRAVREQEADLTRRIGELTLRSPVNGTVMRRACDALTGAYLTEGQEVVTIGNARSKEVRLSLAQNDARWVRAGDGLLCHFAHQEPMHLALQRVSPQATATPSNPALCAAYGGPLAVRARSGGQDDHGKAFEFLEPRIEATAHLDEQQSQHLWAGQRCLVQLDGHRHSVWDHLSQAVAKHLQEKLESHSREAGR